MQVNDDQVVDAVLRASRVLLAVAVRSLAAVDHDVTLPQYRALVVLASRGPQRPTGLADALGVHPSTITRLCDRLVGKRLVQRGESPAESARGVDPPHAEGTSAGRRGHRPPARGDRDDRRQHPRP